MSAPRRTPGLGRGLGELFQRTDPTPARPADATEPSAIGVADPVATDAPTSTSAATSETQPDPELAGARYREIPVADIRPNPRQPRTVFDEDELNELAASVSELGVLQPVVVRELAEGYELVMGERRLRATERAGLTSIPAIIRATADEDLLRDALLENLHRAQLNPLEEAAAYQQLLEDFGCTQEELSTRVHRSRPQISNTLRLLRLPPTVQRRVAAGVLSAGHARALLMLAEPAAQERLAQRIVAEGMSVRATEEAAALGDTGPEPTRPTARRAAEPPEQVARVVDRLADRLDTRVTVAVGKNRGRLTIEFASTADLERIESILLDKSTN